MQTKKLLKTGLGAALLLLLSVLISACGEASKAPEALPTLVPATTSAPAATTARATATTGSARPATTRPATVTATAAAVAEGPSLTAQLPEKTVIRSFTDQQGRAVKLVYGRGSGHSGDYGWAHIYGKHFKGIWYDGGTVTTFPNAVGARTPEEVVNLIGKSIQDKNPDNAGNGRRSYVYPVPGTNKDVFTVAGGDGTIITSYPVAHGSKDEDS